jgi:hypothetical protein
MASSVRYRRPGEAASLPPSAPGPRQRVIIAGTPGMSDPGPMIVPPEAVSPDPFTPFRSC